MQKWRIAILFVLLVCASTVYLPQQITPVALADGYSYVMGTAFYPYSTQPQPRKGASFVDPLFKIQVTRVSNGAKEHGGGNTISGYSTWNPLSSDGRYLLLGGKGYMLYDAHTYAYLKTIPLDWWNGQDPEPRWDYSGTHPSRLYYRKDKQLRSYDVADNSDRLVHDFKADFPNLGQSYYIYNGEEGNPSRDQRYWAFMIRNAEAPYDTRIAFVYDKQANAILGTKDITNLGPNNVMMSPSGEYVYVAYNWSGKGGEYDGPQIYRRDFTSPVHVFTNVPHANFGWTKQGHEVIIGAGCDVAKGSDYYGYVRLDNGKSYTLGYIGDLGWDGGGVTVAYTDQRGWVFFSQYGGPQTHWDDQGVWAMELDETRTFDTPVKPRVWRIAFTQTFGNEYDQQANAQVNYAGTRVWWGSNWRQATGPMDVYEAALPANWASVLGSSDPEAQIFPARLACSSAPLDSRGSFSCQLTLSTPAPAGGVQIALSTADEGITVPSVITVPRGATTASFAVQAPTGSLPKKAILTATSGGIAEGFNVTLNAPGQGTKSR